MDNKEEMEKYLLFINEAKQHLMNKRKAKIQDEFMIAKRWVETTYRVFDASDLPVDVHRLMRDLAVERDKQIDETCAMINDNFDIGVRFIKLSQGFYEHVDAKVQDLQEESKKIGTDSEPIGSGDGWAARRLYEETHQTDEVPQEVEEVRTVDKVDEPKKSQEPRQPWKWEHTFPSWKAVGYEKASRAISGAYKHIDAPFLIGLIPENPPGIRVESIIKTLIEKGLLVESEDPKYIKEFFNVLKTNSWLKTTGKKRGTSIYKSDALSKKNWDNIKNW
jgi:hypothetical protein